jgi:hypothetical protein
LSSHDPSCGAFFVHGISITIYYYDAPNELVRRNEGMAITLS